MKWLLTEDDVKFILDRFLPDNKLRMTTGLLHVVTDIFNDSAESAVEPAAKQD